MPLAVFDRSADPAVPVTYHIHAGRLDEPLVMTDAAKAKVWDRWREPFGAAGVFGADSAALDLRLPGQSVQLETGALHQNWWRDYDPGIGRYIQPDPLGLEAGQNLYGYVDGDPLNAVDPEGLYAGGIITIVRLVAPHIARRLAQRSAAAAIGGGVPGSSPL